MGEMVASWVAEDESQFKIRHLLLERLWWDRNHGRPKWGAYGKKNERLGEVSAVRKLSPCLHQAEAV
jgi:hypothetical protein